MKAETHFGGEEFFLESLDMQRVFTRLERTDYLFLHEIESCTRSGEHPDEGAYLSRVAAQVGVSIPEMSRAARRLQEQGYLVWKTDANKEKTYVRLTPMAYELMARQKEELRRGFEQVKEQISAEELAVTMQTMKKIHQIFSKAPQPEPEPAQ